jgi:hypothetical protein
MNELKRQINRAKITESLHQLAENSRNSHHAAIQFLQIRVEADRILREIYAD